MVRKAKKVKGKCKQFVANPPNPLPVARHVVGTVHPPTSEVVLTVQHSVELVKTVITATMLEIIWNRRIFPEARWETYAYDPADPALTYKSFTDGIETKDRPNFEPTGGLMLWHFPQRGITQGLDKLLACLENGAQDALEKGFLRKLNLTLAFVDDNPISEANLIESYALTFSYANGNGISQICSETRGLQTPKSDPIVLLDAKRGARELVDNVCALLSNGSKCGKLKNYPLPSYYRMSMAMDYHDGTPPDYQAPGFRSGDHSVSRLFRLGHYNENLIMETGFHKVSVSTLLPMDLEEPAQVGAELENRLGGPSYFSRHGSETARFRQASLLSQPEEGQTQQEAMIQIGAMGASRNPNTETQDTRPLHLPTVEPSSAKRRYSRRSPQRPSLPPYTQDIIDFLNSGQLDVNKPENFNCDCGAQNQAGELKVKCLKCGDLHHAHCYGYLDDTHPSSIVCYWCLLHPAEDDLYEQMQRLCVFRRVLHYLFSHGPTVDVDEIYGHLDRTSEEIEGFLNLLQSTDRYIRLEQGRCTLVEDEETIRSIYFRPQKYISHHFAMPSGPVTSSADIPQNPGRRQLLEEASSTQDASSRRTSPELTPSLSRRYKRLAESATTSVPPKRQQQQYPDVASPWIRRIDA